MKKLLRVLSLGLWSPRFTHNAKDFKIKIVWAWFADRCNPFVRFKYSANGGISWKYILEAGEPLLYDGTWELVRATYDLEDAEMFIEQFKSYQNVLDFEKEQVDLVLKGRKKRKRERQATIKAQDELLKRLNM